MANITTEWQEIGRVTFYSSDTISLQVRYTSQSSTNNTTHVEARIVNVGTYWRTSNGSVTFTGEFTNTIGCATYPNYINQNDEIAIVGKDVPHDENGDRYIYIGATISAIINGSTRTGTIAQTFVQLPHINRYATFGTWVNDFNDEQNPYFTFSNPAEYRINARLEFSGQSIRRDNIPNTGAYTFELTDAERTLLRTYCTGKTLSVNYVLATCYIGSTEAHTESATRTMTMVNANPTFSVTYQDTNATTLAITNNNQQIIQSNSTLQFNIANATALKGASLNKVKVNINGVVQEQSISSSTLAFNYGTINVSSNINANVVLIDSRGFETTIPVALTVLSWSLPSAIITLLRKSNYYTETDITIDANYSSLDSKNTILIKYRYKKTTSATWSAYVVAQDNVQSTFNADNLYEWDVQVLVQDSLGSTTYNLKLGIGQPILFVDRRKRNVGIDCFPQSTNAFEVQGNAQVRGDLLISDSSGNNLQNVGNGLVYDSGSNANGYYIRFNSGIMICCGRTINQNCGGLTTTAYYLTLPQSFKNNDYSITLSRRSGGAYFASTLERTNNVQSGTFEILVWNNNSSTAEAIQFDYMAMGMWK